MTSRNAASIDKIQKGNVNTMSPNLSGIHLPYQIHTLTEKDLEKMYALCKANKIYYEHMRFEPTCENLRESMTALPQG